VGKIALLNKASGVLTDSASQYELEELPIVAFFDAVVDAVKSLGTSLGLGIHL
jgi:hypothetical protein